MGGRWGGESRVGRTGNGAGWEGQRSPGLANPDPANPNCVAQQRGGFWEPWLLGKALLAAETPIPGCHRARTGSSCGDSAETTIPSDHWAPACP